MYLCYIGYHVYPVLVKLNKYNRESENKLKFTLVFSSYAIAALVEDLI